MKKVLIAMLAVLLLLSFTSCEKDKSEEVIAVYEEFITVNNICERTDRMLSGIAIDKDNTVNEGMLASLLRVLDGTDAEIHIKSNKISSGSKNSSTSEDGTTTRTYSDVGIEYTYTEGSDSTVKSGTFSVDGTYVNKSPEIRAASAYKDASYEMTINGVKYKLSYYRDYYGKYTRASVNGKDVEIRLLNSTLDYEAL